MLGLWERNIMEISIPASVGRRPVAIPVVESLICVRQNKGMLCHIKTG